MKPIKPWYALTLGELFDQLSVTQQGLTREEAQERLNLYGPNKFIDYKAESIVAIFFRQFQSPLIYILVGAAVLVFAMGEMVDGFVILLVLLLNALIGAYQEGKAQNTLLALKKLTESKATVLRDGKEVVLFASELVPGDIISIGEGEVIPADARLVKGSHLCINEAALTGESAPVDKNIETILDKETPLGEQKNMVFKGTHVTAGNGEAIVVATGLSTVFGSIAKQIALIDTEVPLKKNIRDLSRLIISVAGAICGLIFLLGVAAGHPLHTMLMTIVSLAVSIIPEGLPIVMTLVLAIGVWRMSKRHVLVKKLQAVEALGQADIIAVDKTGTLTKNELVVTKVYADNQLFDVRGDGYNPDGRVYQAGKEVLAGQSTALNMLAQIAVICANAKIFHQEVSAESIKIMGDPTDAAMLVFGEKLGVKKAEMEQRSPRYYELPLDYKLRYHAVVYGVTGAVQHLAIVGAPETILARSSQMWRNGKIEALSIADKSLLEKIITDMSQQGLRVIACAQKQDVVPPFTDEVCNQLTFYGVLGMEDPLRPEVAEAVLQASKAGIRTVMITGDHKITAKAIAQAAGIFHEGDNIVTGADIDIWSEQQLAEKVRTASIFARVSPNHKLAIIKAFKAGGEIVAMTGDGINDAPSLVAADLGVAMGKIGTEVAKEAADLVLLNDDLGGIVAAVEEGRNIYKTIKKVLLYLFAGSFSQVFTIVGALLFGLPLPLLAAQIIWLNFVTDGFLNIGLAMEPHEEDLLPNTSLASSKNLLDKLMAVRILLAALPLASGTLFLFSYTFTESLNKGWTMVLTALALGHLANAWNCRSAVKSLFRQRLLGNKYLCISSVIVVTLQLLAIYTPFMQKILRTVSLGVFDWIAVLSIGVALILLEEIRKTFWRISQ